MIPGRLPISLSLSQNRTLLLRTISSHVKNILDRDLKAEDAQIRQYYEYLNANNKIGRTTNPFGFELELRRTSHGLGLFCKSGIIPAFTACAIYPGILFSPSDPKLWWGFFNNYLVRRDDGWVVDGKPFGLSAMTYKSLHGRSSDKVTGDKTCDTSWLQAEAYRNNNRAQQQQDNNVIWFHCGHYINHSWANNNNVEYVQKNFHVESFTITNEQEDSSHVCWLPNVEYSSSSSSSEATKTLPGIIMVSNREICAGEELTANYENVISETSR